MNAVKAVRKQGNYRLYKNGAAFELWLGTKADGVVVNADVASAEDFEYVIDIAEEDFRGMLASF